jgi:1,4-dihydroxy-2-naphthoate octaprenyltransferase
MGEFNLKITFIQSDLNLDTIGRIIQLGRLKFPLNGFLLFSFGTLLAAISGAKLDFNRFLLGYAVLFTANLSISYSNDYFDIGVDQYTKPTAVSGGSGILLMHPELRPFSKRFALFLMGVSVTLGVLITLAFPLHQYFPVVVVLGNLLIWYYSAPPIRLSYRGLGEITTIIALGLMIPGIGYYIFKESLDQPLPLFILPLLLYSLVFIVSVEIPDMEGDELGNKRTLIVRKGRKYGFKTIAASLSLSTLYFLIVCTINPSPSPIDFCVVSLFSAIPLTLGIIGLLKIPEEREPATRLVTLNIASLTIFLLLMDSYLIMLLKQS